jgi:C4-dicarboxylate-specific signal transduction histidine kinase
VLQILVNVFRNAKYAMDEQDPPVKRVVVRVGMAGPERVKIVVVDNGIGIPGENLTKIFNHGFTTRQTGHGFGLHSGANAAKEMGGTLTAHSEGPGKGADFTLELPTTASRSKETMPIEARV